MLTKGGVEAKKLKKNAKFLHRIGTGVQDLTFFNPRQRVELASKRQKKGDFRARMTLYDELFFVVILNTLWQVCGDFFMDTILKNPRLSFFLSVDCGFYSGKIVSLQRESIAN